MPKLTLEQLRARGLEPSTLPQHVAIIMDGNGRWAKRRGAARTTGHRAGVEALRAVIRFSSDSGIKALTLYAFSTENWKRPREELGVLFSLLVEYFTREIDELDRNDVRIRIIGDPGVFPQNVRQAIDNAERVTADNDGLRLNIALNYGARAELLHAAQACCVTAMETGRLPDAAALESHLYTAGLPDPDLLIRTSGEQRLSNYLLYQAAYAELYFTDTLWPDFDENAYCEALRFFAGRSRRFGGLEG